MSTEQLLPKLIMYHGQILVPNVTQKQILETPHMQHCGARQLYFWIGMTDQIKLMTSRCETCLKLKPSKPVDPIIQTHTSRPFNAVSIDLGYLEGIHYLILAYWFSGWPMVKLLTKQNTKSITTILDDWFINMGKPVQLRSDGGPQLRSEFEDWANKENITHEPQVPTTINLMVTQR